MISVFGSDITSDEIQKVTECLESQWLGLGSVVSQFEKTFQETFNLPSFAMVDSGSNALFMAVSLLDLPPGTEIILPSFTWVSCAQAVILAGHKPVFCDVDPETMNVRAEDVATQISDKTGAIMIVHYAGLPVDMDPILELGFPVIEDAAHATASSYKGLHCGAIGAVGIYSFDAVKNLTAGEGGGIVCQDQAVLERAKTLRYCGIGKSGFESAAENASGNWWEYNITEPFIKMLPNNIAASIALAQLERFPKLQARREQIWSVYSRELANVDQISLPVEAPVSCRHSYFTYCIKAERRNELAKFLLQEEIYTTLRYHPLHLNKLYGQEEKSLPNTEMLNEKALSIPLHPRLTNSEVSLVIEKIKQFYQL